MGREQLGRHGPELVSGVVPALVTQNLAFYCWWMESEHLAGMGCPSYFDLCGYYAKSKL